MSHRRPKHSLSPMFNLAWTVLHLTSAVLHIFSAVYHARRVIGEDNDEAQQLLGLFPVD